MDSSTAFDTNLSPFPFFSLFLGTQLILFVLLLCYRSLLLTWLKSFLGFFLSFFHPTHQNIQTILVIKEHRNQELFASIHTYITYRLLPPVGVVVEITKPEHSNTIIWCLGQDQEIPDTFRGVQLKWVLRVRPENGLIGRFRKSRCFELYVPKEHLAEVRALYLQSYVLEEAARILRQQQQQQRRRRRRTDGCVGWVNVIAGLLIHLIGCC